MYLTIDAEEQESGTLCHESLRAAVDAFRRDGYVILEDAIEHVHLDRLREQMDADSHRLIAEERWGGAGRVQGHLQQGPPPWAPFVVEEIVANPYALQITHTLLGDGLYNRFYSGNTNTPGSQIQPLHLDAPHLWPEQEVAHPPATVIINFSLIDVDDENGATELWPGTHRIPLSVRSIDEQTAERRRTEVPPIRAESRKGSLLLRDPRVWHRGMPNYSQTNRHMIALIHNISWLARPQKLLFHESCRDAFPPDSVLDHNVEFTERPLSYLYSRFAVVEDEAAAG